MHVTFHVGNFDYQIQSILSLLKADTADRRLEPFMCYYPQIDWKGLIKMPEPQKRDALVTAYHPLYQQKSTEMIEKAAAYQKEWDIHENIIIEAFSGAFEEDLTNLFQNIHAYVTGNPVCPRYLNKMSFDVFSQHSERGALGMALHEVTHFIWFRKWQMIFEDNPRNYEAPHLQWIFSEMAIDAILQDDRLLKLNPFAEEGCAYACFYPMTVNGEKILPILSELYQQNNIRVFMEQGYALCRKYETEIRSQMNL